MFIFPLTIVYIVLYNISEMRFNYHTTPVFVKVPAVLLFWSVGAVWGVVCLVLWGGMVGSVNGGSYDRDKDIVDDKVIVYRDAGCVTAHGLAVIDEDTLLVAESYAKGGVEGGERLVKRVKLDHDNDDDDNSSVEAGDAVLMSDFSSLPYKQPCGLAKGGDGVIYVCDTIEARIYTHDLLTGKLTGAIATAGMPWNMRVLEDGTIWYLTTNGRLHCRKPNGVTQLVHAKNKINDEEDENAGIDNNIVEIKTAFDFAIDEGKGVLYVTRQRPGAVIAVNIVDGSWRVVSDKFVNPGGIELSKDGRFLYVADTEDNKVYRLNVAEGSDSSDLVVIMDGEELGFTMPICVRRSSGGNRLFVTGRVVEDKDSDDSKTHTPVIVEYLIGE